MRVSVPGSTANLGPAFDSLGIAVALYVHISIEQSDHFVIEATGEGTESCHIDERHPAAVLAREILGNDNFTLTIDSEIPMSRGLGSSGAMAIGVAAACG